MTRRHFGNIRRQASGRWQVRYKAPDGRERQGERTFATRREAEAHLAEIHAAMTRGSWMDPRSRELTLGAYADEWMKHRKLAITTREHYEDLLRTHIRPQLGGMPLGKITLPEVRRWHAGRNAATGPTRVSHAYKLLKAILTEAVKDGLIAANPCQISSAGSVSTPERPYMSREQMEALAAAMPADMRPIVIITFYAHLRLGELLALSVGDIDMENGKVHVRRAIARTKSGPVEKETKTGNMREVHLPSQALTVLAEHLAAMGPSLPSARVFRHVSGKPLAAHHLRVAWSRARKTTGLTQFHLHDLRHAGLTFVAQHGASLRHLQSRAGHKTFRAAMIYQHVAEELDAALAERMSDSPSEGLASG